MDINKTIGINIRAFRETSDVTQAGLGQLLGIGWQQISRYERGISPIKAKDLFLVAEGLNTDVSNFFKE